MSEELMRQQAEVFRGLVAQDPEAWFRHFAVIKDKEGRLCGYGHARKVEPNILQERCFAYYRQCQIAVKPCLMLELKPRQKGASTVAEAIAYHHARRNLELNGSLMGDIQATSDKVFEIFRRFARHDGFPWPDGFGRLQEEGDNVDDIVLPGGSTYHKETAGSKNAGRSGTIQVARMTEPAFFSQDGGNDPVLAYLNSFNEQSPLSLGIADTTPNGPRGWFYETSRSQSTHWRLIFAAWFEFADSTKAFAGGAEERAAFLADLTADERDELLRFGQAPDGREVITAEHLHWRRYTIADKCGGDIDKFRQEYPSDPVECFLKSARPRFNLAVLADWEAAAKGVFPVKVGSFNVNSEDGTASFVPNEAGGTKIFEEPRLGCSYLLAGDYMTGEDQADTGETADPDWHDLQVWRAPFLDDQGRTHLRKLVARHRSQVDTDLVAMETYGLSLYYGGCLIIPEVNGPGLHIVKKLQELGAHVYNRRLLNTTTNNVERKLGWKTDGITRKTIIDQLAADVRERLLDIPDLEVVTQLKDFVTNKRGKPEAMSGRKDDAVLACAIANANFGMATPYELKKRRRVSDRMLRRHPGMLFRDGTRVVVAK